MRRKMIGLATVAIVAAVMFAQASARSAVDRPAVADPPLLAGVPTTSTTPSANPPVTAPAILPSAEFTGAIVYAAAETATSTGWQLASGVYYLGGEFIETGRILGTQAAGMLGLVAVQAETMAPAGTASNPRERVAIEDQRFQAWATTGQTDHTPVLPAPSVIPVGSTPVVKQPAVPTPAGNVGPSIQKASLRDAPATKAGPRPGCAWPGIAPVEGSKAEAAVMTSLTDLGLLDEPAIRLPDGAVFLPKVSQRLLQIRTGYPCKGTVNTSRTLVGHVIADPMTSGLVQASQDGRVEAASWGLPRLGQRVTEGEILGYLRPIWSNRDRAEMEATIATLRGEIAEKELELARSRELPMLPFRQGRILSIRLELDKLRRHRDALVEGLEGAEPIVASASGVIARADARVGQVVETRHLLWEIVDEQRLWVEADWFGGEPPATIAGASATRSDGTTLALVFEGGGWALTGQSTPLQFRVEAPSTGLRVGERVTVLVPQPASGDGMLIPKSAPARRSNGETGVWAASAAERFEVYRIRWKPVDGNVISVEAGLPEGARVVVNGATLLSEVR